MKGRLAVLEEQVKGAETTLEAAVQPIGNLVHDSVPVSNDEVHPHLPKFSIGRRAGRLAILRATCRSMQSLAFQIEIFCRLCSSTSMPALRCGLDFKFELLGAICSMSLSLTIPAQSSALLAMHDRLHIAQRFEFSHLGPPRPLTSPSVYCIPAEGYCIRRWLCRVLPDAKG